MKTLLVVALVAGLAAAISSYGARVSDRDFIAGHVPANLEVLTDRGKVVRFATESANTYVVFGYTRCADECPLVLASLTSQLRGRTAPTRVLFVTTDPQYDSTFVLASYAARWKGAVEGITGDAGTIRQLYQAFTGAPSLPSSASDHVTQAYYVDGAGDITLK